MLTRLLNTLFLALSTRPVMILTGLLLLGVTFILGIEQWHFAVQYWGIHPDDHTIEEIEEAIDGLGLVYVAIGVYLEERETLRHLAHRHTDHHSEESPREQYLNEVAHQNGMGLLLMGLFMEVAMLALKLPDRIVYTHGLEAHCVAACIVMSGICVIILIDFLKDYAKTYVGTIGG
jgi:hypothetical protein